MYSEDRTRLLLGNADLNSYTVQPGTRAICENAFAECNTLSNIVLPPELEQIGFAAFSDCTALKTITLPESLNIIDGNPFNGAGLTQIICLSPHFTVQNNMLYDDTRLICYFGNEKIIDSIPAELSIIDEGAFWGKSTIEKIQLPQNIKYIRAWAFANCKQLKEIALGKAELENLNETAFLNCEKVKITSENTQTRRATIPFHTFINDEPTSKKDHSQRDEWGADAEREYIQRNGGDWIDD